MTEERVDEFYENHKILMWFLIPFIFIFVALILVLWIVWEIIKIPFMIIRYTLGGEF